MYIMYSAFILPARSDSSISNYAATTIHVRSDYDKKKCHKPYSGYNANGQLSEIKSNHWLDPYVLRKVISEQNYKRNFLLD